MLKRFSVESRAKAALVLAGVTVKSPAEQRRCLYRETQLLNGLNPDVMSLLKIKHSSPTKKNVKTSTGKASSPTRSQVVSAPAGGAATQRRSADAKSPSAPAKGPSSNVNTTTRVITPAGDSSRPRGQQTQPQSSTSSASSAPVKDMARLHGMPAALFERIHKGLALLEERIISLKSHEDIIIMQRSSLQPVYDDEYYEHFESMNKTLTYIMKQFHNPLFLTRTLAESFVAYDTHKGQINVQPSVLMAALASRQRQLLRLQNLTQSLSSNLKLLVQSDTAQTQEQHPTNGAAVHSNDIAVRRRRLAEQVVSAGKGSAKGSRGIVSTATLAIRTAYAYDKIRRDSAPQPVLMTLDDGSEHVVPDDVELLQRLHYDACEHFALLMAAASVNGGDSLAETLSTAGGPMHKNWERLTPALQNPVLHAFDVATIQRLRSAESTSDDGGKVKSNGAVKPNEIEDEVNRKRSVDAAVHRLMRTLALFAMSHSTQSGGYTWLVYNPKGRTITQSHSSETTKEEEHTIKTEVNEAQKADEGEKTNTEESKEKEKSDDKKSTNEEEKEATETSAMITTNMSTTTRMTTTYIRSGRLEVINTPRGALPLTLGVWPLLCVDVTAEAYLTHPSDSIETRGIATPTPATSPPAWSRAARLLKKMGATGGTASEKEQRQKLKAEAQAASACVRQILEKPLPLRASLQQQKVHHVAGFLSTIDWSWVGEQLELCQKWYGIEKETGCCLKKLVKVETTVKAGKSKPVVSVRHLTERDFASEIPRMKAVRERQQTLSTLAINEIEARRAGRVYTDETEQVDEDDQSAFAVEAMEAGVSDDQQSTETEVRSTGAEAALALQVGEAMLAADATESKTATAASTTSNAGETVPEPQQGEGAWDYSDGTKYQYPNGDWFETAQDQSWMKWTYSKPEEHADQHSYKEFTDGRTDTEFADYTLTEYPDHHPSTIQYVWRFKTGDIQYQQKGDTAVYEGEPPGPQ